jgi:hypothetical protein
LVAVILDDATVLRTFGTVPDNLDELSRPVTGTPGTSLSSGGRDERA